MFRKYAVMLSSTFQADNSFQLEQNPHHTNFVQIRSSFTVLLHLVDTYAIASLRCSDIDRQILCLLYIIHYESL